MWRLKDKTLHGVEADKLKRNAGIYAILITALAAMTFFGVCDPRTVQRMGPTGAAAVVDGEHITRFEFQRAYRGTYDRYQKMYGDAFDPSSLRLAQSVMRQLVDDRATFLWSRSIGLEASEDEALSLLAKEDVFKGDDGQFSAEKLENYLQGQGYTEASFLGEVRRSLTTQKLRRFVADTSFVSSKAAGLEYRVTETKLDLAYIKVDPQLVKVQVAPTDIDQFLANEKDKQRVKEYYDQNQREFKRQEEIRARHILISFKGARNSSPQAAAREKNQALALAKETLQKIKDGQDFVALAKATTDEQVGKTSGGDLGFFTRDRMDPAFSNAAFALNQGQVSDVIETPFGYHIIKVEEKKAAQETSLEAAQRNIAENLIAKEKRPVAAKEQADRVVNGLTSGRPIDNLLVELGLKWAETGEFNADTRYVPGIGGASDLGDALVTLSKEGQVYPSAVNIRGNLFVFKLKKKKEPDMQGLDASKTRELKLMASYTEGESRLNEFEKKAREKLEKSHDIWMNPEYLSMDEKSSQQATGENGE